MKTFTLACFTLAVCVGHAPRVFAQAYPAKPVRLIIPFPPGGSTDVIGRAFGGKLSEAWNQPVVIENRGGANTIIAAEAAAKSAPDGYTLFLTTAATMTTNTLLYRKLPYDAKTSFALISMLTISPYLIAAHPSLPARGVKELLALARARPGEITWSCGGSPSQLAAELFKKTAGVNVIVVPYKGNAPAVTAAMSGEVSLSFGNVAQSVPQVKAGRLRALGVGSLQRSAVMPDVPTVAEAGLAGFEAGAWYGVLAPAATPRAIVDRLGGELVRILKLPDVQQRLRGEAYDVIADTPDQFAAAIRAEIAKWAPLVKQAGLRVD